MEQDWSGEDVYRFGKGDKSLVRFATALMVQAMKAPVSSWAERVTIAKLIHVFSRLPYRSQALNVQVSITSPRKRYGDAEIYFHLSIGVESDDLVIRYGGHYYHPRTGGDSFTVFDWWAAPDEDPQYTSHLEGLRVVTALVNPMDVMRRMGEALNEYRLSTDDSDNELVGDEDIPDEPRTLDPAYDLDEHELEANGQQEVDEDADGEDDEDEDFEDEDEPLEPLQIQPVTAADRQLLQQMGAAQVSNKNTGNYAHGISHCDGCGVDLSAVGLFVDGASRGGNWGNYCAHCCLQQGIAVGWGKGQLYARQPDERWALIAGLRR